jgi:hypothetical protein
MRTLNTDTYISTLEKTITTDHLSNMSDSLLEFKLGRAEKNITWYIGQFEFWTNELLVWIDRDTVEDMSIIPLEAMKRNEALAEANITAWYAIMGEMVMRRFEEAGCYVAPDFDVEGYVDFRKGCPGDIIS